VNEFIACVLDSKGHDVETVEADVPILDAVQRMNARHIGSLVVVEGDQLTGIVTERDILTRVVANLLDPVATTVGEVMTHELVVLTPEMTVAEAMMVVTDRRCRHLPVIDHGRLCGLISAGDLAQWTVRDQKRTIFDLTDYITR
jgi:CBS domain-containing protein